MVDRDAAERAISRLRESMPTQAVTMADELDAAVVAGDISEGVVARHSKWCHTGGSWAAGMDAARVAAVAMYGTVPERMVDSEDRRTERYEEALLDLAAAMRAEWDQEPSAGADHKLPATRRRSTDEAVTTEAARAAWAIAAHEVLVTVAQTYNATLTYSELAEEVQARTDIVTAQLTRDWIGDVLARVADACVEAEQPLVTAVCVQATGVVGDGYGAAVERATGSIPDDLQTHAAEERLRCYRHFGAALPEDGGRPTLTQQEQARRERTRATSTASAKKAVCPNVLHPAPADRRLRQLRLMTEETPTWH